MKIQMLFPIAVSATLDDSSTLLSVATQSNTALNLMNAVGHRNVTAMQSLVQEIVEESISEPGWKFDADIQDALKAIKNMFVKSIQGALKDQHKADQEHFNCFTQDCFGGCIAEYDKTMENCKATADRCEGLEDSHMTCRAEVYEAYKAMWKACGPVHCATPYQPDCPTEDCLCPELTHCAGKTAYGCTGASGSCSGKLTNDQGGNFGGWLLKEANKFKAEYAEWKLNYAACTDAYHKFLTADMKCDTTQKTWEKCLCERNACESQACNTDYDQCEAQCWAQYSKLVKEKECLEKDRKIDWSATKKIECYIDVLLHDYTEDDLLTKCGKKDCVNQAREIDYKECSTRCIEVDHEGYWPDLKFNKMGNKDGDVKVKGHAQRKDKKDEHGLHLGDDNIVTDGEYKCDVSVGVFTKHRGGAKRFDENRCTEHLDIDYQVPQCKACEPEPEPVCDEDFHKKYYNKYDVNTKIGCITDCCHESSGGPGCFPDADLRSFVTGKETTLKVEEHSHAWAYNRCACTECALKIPEYGTRPEGRQCGMGAHTISPGKARNVIHKNVCVSARGNKFATLPIKKDICAKSITVTHVSGQVSCAGNGGMSNFGCGGNSMGLVIQDGNAVTAPAFDTVTGMTPHYSGHAHWYNMDGVGRKSEEMAWIFREPFVFAAKDYKLWYNEDLTGGTEGDNAGRACYDVAFDISEDAECGALAPLQFHKVCLSARGGAHGVVAVPAGTCITEIAVHHISGYVSCVGAHHLGHRSNFGCHNNLMGLVFTPHDKTNVIMPHANQVEGVTRTSHGHAHWYTMAGVGRTTRTLSFKLKNGVKPVKASGSLDLWYNEDLTGGTEGDNSGSACYEVSVHRALSC